MLVYICRSVRHIFNVLALVIIVYFIFLNCGREILVRVVCRFIAAPILSIKSTVLSVFVLVFVTLFMVVIV